MKSIEKKSDRIYYKDFPDIKGDGVTNDFAAIKAVHDIANASGQTVVAEDGKTYYIRETGGNTINIKTSVEFGTAHFIIDDTWIDYTPEYTAERCVKVFTICGDSQPIRVTPENDSEGILAAINARGGIKRSDTHLDLGLGYKAMLIPVNNEVYMYNRWGQHAGDLGPDEDKDGVVDDGHENAGKLVGGNPQHELMIIEADGTIDKDAALLFDYDRVSAATIIRIDDAPITVSGGIFTTLANRANDNIHYFNRGILISRSNVTITDMKHYVEEGEKTAASPYSGWIFPMYANNLTVRDTLLSGRQYFRQGNYDIGGSFANDLKFINVTQLNFFKDEASETVYRDHEYWGIMGTNYCKNITYDNCFLSRLDAHAGVVNVKVKDTIIRSISLTGGGNALIENCKIYNNFVVYLREDYGSTWRGDITVKNCQLVIQDKNGSCGAVHGTYHNWAFGYNSVMPQNITVDNLTASAPTLKGSLVVYCNIEEEQTSDIAHNALGVPAKNRNKVETIKSITLKNQTQQFTSITSRPWCSERIKLVNE